MPNVTNQTGTHLLRLGKKHLKEKYILGALAPKDNASWTGPWDCAEFASWLVFQTTGSLYGCKNPKGSPANADAYTGFWARDAKKMGKIITVNEAASIPGAAVLRVPKESAIGHIVIADGSGGTIEAHSSKRGVIASTLDDRRWDYGILVPGIAYVAKKKKVDVKLPRVTIYRLLTPPMQDAVVKRIQTALKAAGFHPGKLDGVFGLKTHAAVVAYQLIAGLLADGEVGPVTAKALGIVLK